MYITLKEFLNNPMGKGAAAIPNKSLIQSDLKTRYNKISSKMQVKAYYDDKSGSYFFHFIIPSETERKNTYDVVLQFEPKDNGMKNENTILNYNIRFFSNSPSFGFTYAYVFNERDMLIKSLKNKFSGVTLTDSPVVRNPNVTVNYEKSTFFACHFISENKAYVNKEYLATVTAPYTKSFPTIIRTTNQVLKEISLDKERIKLEKEEQKIHAERKNLNRPHVKQPKKSIGSINKIKAKPARGSSIKKIDGRSNLKKRK